MATATVQPPADGAPEDAAAAPVLEIMRTLTLARGGLEARLLEAARVAVAASGDELLVLKGHTSVDELTDAQRLKWRAEAKSCAVAELQVKLGLSRDEARQLVGIACAPGDIPALVIQALDRGWASWWQVRLFWTRCAKLDPEEAELIAQALFGSDPALAARERLDPDGGLRDEPWPHSTYRAALDREATAAEGKDPDAERARRKAAYQARHVSFTANEDGTGTMTLTTDLVSICGIQSRMDRITRLLRSHGDTRTLDELSADVVAALLLDGTIALLDKDEDDLTPGDREELARILAGQPRVNVQVVVGWDSLTRTPTCPSCGRGFDGGQAFGDGEGPDRREGDSGPTQRGPDPPGQDCGPPRRGGVAEILGRLGAFITPGHARELALRPGTTFYRLLTDPADGRLIERTITAYRPDAEMRRQILAADVYSRAPGSRQPASSGEIDHVVPWTGDGSGGPTGELNLASLNKEFHQRKTKRRYQLAINERRDLTWTTLLGKCVTTRVHDYTQYLQRIRPVSTASDGDCPHGRDGDRPIPRDGDRPIPRDGERPIARDDCIRRLRPVYRTAAADRAREQLAAPRRAASEPGAAEEEMLDRLRLVAAKALYAALVHRGGDAFLEDDDDQPGAVDHGGPRAGWMWVTHAHPVSGRRRPGPPADHPTPEEVLGLTTAQDERDGSPPSKSAGPMGGRDSRGTPWASGEDPGHGEENDERPPF